MKLFYVLVCSLVFFTSTVAYATTIIYVTQNGAGSKDGSSWSNALNGVQLKSAIDNAVSGTDFWVAAGIYYPGASGNVNASFNLKNGVGIYGGFSGSEVNFSERSISLNTTTFNGDLDRNNFYTSADAIHVIYSIYNDNTAVIDGVTVTRGYASSSNGGGGILAHASSALIRNCIFIQNWGSYYGGAIALEYEGGQTSTLTFVNCSFSGNYSYYGGVGTGAGNTNFTNCIFNNNNGYYSIFNLFQGVFNFNNCSFVSNTDNHSSPGGTGIVFSSADVNLTNCVLWNNTNYAGQATTNPDELIRINSGTCSINYSDIQTGWASGTGNFNANPRFANGAFELAQCSPLIDAGTNSGITATDYKGNARPYNNGTSDIGAYEYQGNPVPTFTPTVTITGPSTICMGSEAIYNATVTNTGSGVSYQWQVNGVNVGSNSASFSSSSLAGNNSITCAITSADICASPANVTSTAINTTVLDLPVVTIVGSNAICGSNPIALSAGETHNNYLWSTGQTTASVSVNAPALYTLSSTGANGCVNTDTLTVIQNKAVMNPVAVPSTICEGQSTELKGGLVSGPGTKQTSVYYGDLQFGNFGGICSGSNVRVSRDANPGFSWQDNGSGIVQSVKVEFNVGIEASGLQTHYTTFNGSSDPSGTFQSTPANSNCFLPPSSSNDVTLNLTPSLYSVGGKNTIIISNQAFYSWGLSPSQDGGAYVKITVTYFSYNGTYSWSPGGEAGENITVTPPTTTTYTVTANKDGCIATADVTVNVTARPVISANGPVTDLCQTASVTLTSTPADTYLWSTGETTKSITVHNPGTYTLSANSCAAIVPVVVEYKPLPIISPSGPTTFCPGYAIDLTASDGDGYLWSTGAATQSIHVSQAGNYSVTVTKNGCAQTVSQQIIVQPIPKPELGIYVTDICTSLQNYINFSINNNWDYNLTYTVNSDSLQQPYNGYFNTAYPGAYTVTGTDPLGCTSQPSNPIIITEAQGNPDAFGDNVWNVYLFDNGNYWGYDEPWQHYTKKDIYGSGDSTTLNLYHGYYTENNLSFDTRSKWDENGSPANAPGFLGCDLPFSWPDYFSWSAKRKGFPCGNYSISIPIHDDDAQLLINGAIVWQETGFVAGANNNIWQGVLGPGTTIEFRVKDYEGACSGTINIDFIDNGVVPSAPTITPGGPTTFCPGGSVTLTSSSASGNQWYLNGNAIGGATAQDYIANASGDYTVTSTPDGCPFSTSSITTITVKSIPNALATPSSQTVCSGTSSSIALASNVTGATFSWTVAQSGVSGASPGSDISIAQILTATGTTPGTATYTITPLVNGCEGAAITAIVTVNPLPTATVSGSTTVCQNAGQPNITFTGSGGTAPYTFTYSLFDGTNTATGLIMSGSPSAMVPVPTGLTGTYTYTLLSVQDGASTACSQTITGQTASVIVKQPPTATIGGTTAVCQNTVQPNVAFTASGGNVPYTFSYSLSDGTNTTTGTVSGSSSATVPAPTVTAGTYTYTLLSVQDAGSTGCAQTITGETAIVTVNPLPDAGIITASPVTAASTSNVASVTNAGSGSTYVWTVTNGTITGGSGTNMITYTAGVSGSVSISVKVTSGSSCGPITGTQLVTITPQTCPNAAITVAAAVCTSSAGNIASVTSAGTGATYAWSITNGAIAGGSGTRSIIYTAGVSGFVSLSVKVTNSSKVCSVSSGTYRVFISPLPAASILASASVCKSSTGNTALVPAFSTGSTYSWAITNGTITAGSGTSKITYTAGASGSVTLAVTVTNTTGCKASSGNKLVAIVAYPVATITTASSVCAASNNNTASVASGGTGARYAWTITNGVITAGSSTNNITWSAGISGSVTLAVKVTNSSGCSTSSGNKLVTINASPNAGITTSSSVCAGSTGTASVTGGAAGYSWSIINGTIPGSKTTNSVSYIAGTSGTITLSVTVTNASGCKASGKISVIIKALPAATITASSVVCTGSTGNTASVAGAGSGALYSWTISNGTITSGSGTAGIKYTAAAPGSVMLGITVTNSGSCKVSGTKAVTSTAKVTPTFARIGPLCLNAKAPTLPATSTNGIPGTWSPAKISTSSTGTKIYTFTPGSGQCALSATMSITVQNCNTLSLIAAKQPTIGATILDAKVAPNPSETEFTLTLRGNSHEPVEIRVIDMYGRSIHYARGSANESYKFGQRFAGGVYIVEILQGKLVKTLKIIKAK